MSPRISIIVAADPAGVIGINGKLPWHSVSDLRSFRSITEGGIVVMGRHTWDTCLPAKVKPLPGRVNVVLSSAHRAGIYCARGYFTSSDILTTVQFARNIGHSEIFFIGGAKVYNNIISRADRIYFSHMHRRVENPSGGIIARFPTGELSLLKWECTYSEARDDHTFKIYDRIQHVSIS